MRNNLTIRMFFTVFITINALVSLAQTKVTGRVTDAQTQAGIPNVLIQTKGDQAITDYNGVFIISWSGSDSSLSLSRLGYYSKSINLTEPESPLQISLSPNPLQLSSVVVSADHIQRSYQEYPGSLGLLLPKELERDQDLSIVNAINRVPGIVMQSGALNTNRITIRGMGSRSPFSTNRVKAYFGEIPLTTGDGETTLEDIDLAFIERVEIIKGPNASLYGAGLGGTIRLEPRAVQKGLEINAQQSFGSYGLSRQVVNISKGSEKFDVQAGVTSTNSDGYRENNEYDRMSAMIRASIKANKHRWRFLGQYISLDAQIPSSLNRATFESDPRAAAANWLEVAGFESYQRYLIGVSHQWTGNRVTSKTALFTTFQDMDERRPFNVLEDNRTMLGLRTVWTGTITDNMFWSGGAELLHETYNWETFETLADGRGPLLSDNLEMRAYQNIFGQAEWAFLPKWQAVLGANVNFTYFDLEDRFLTDGDLSESRNFEPVFSPRATMSYKPSELATIYTSVNHGFSTPSLEETLTPDGNINPDIKPETGWSFELGSKGSFLKSFNYQIALYHMPVKNLLVARRTAEDAFIGINAGKTMHNGLEVDLSKNWTIGKKNSMSAFLSYLEARYSFKDFVDNEERFDGNELTGTPNRTLSAGLDLNTFWGTDFYINTQYVGEMPLNDANTLYNESYIVWNLKMTHTLNKEKWQLTFFAGINNLWDQKYASMVQINARGFGGNAPRYFYPGLPRNYFGGIVLRFKE